MTVFELATGRVQWLRDPERAPDLEGPLGPELFERLEPLAEDEVRALGDDGAGPWPGRNEKELAATHPTHPRLSEVWSRGSS